MTDSDATPGAERYAAGQLARATAVPAGGASVSASRVEGWLAVLAGLSSGGYFLGSRGAPVQGVPVWATLEVMHGGFASGCPLAELGEGAVPNAWYFTPEGVQRLAQLLDSGGWPAPMFELSRTLHHPAAFQPARMRPVHCHASCQ